MLGYFLINLGCPKNEVDGQYLEGILKEEGFLPTPLEKSDIIIVNTCGFIAPAQEESINTILKAAEYKKERNLKLIVVGCLSQRFGQELVAELPEVDVFMGVGIEGEFRELLKNLLQGELKGRVVSSAPPFSQGDYSASLRPHGGPSAYLKIAEGCDNRCSYCAIPDIRGPYRSRPKKELIQECQALVDGGTVEIILVAQDITRYGIDLYERPALTDLLEELVQIEGLKWVRLMYLQPEGITDELLQLMAENPKIVEYLEIPIQHISGKILKDMNRAGDAESLVQKIEHIRKIVPGVVLRTSLMVGFPGESREDFARLESFVARGLFDRMGVFAYSPEKGTPAAEKEGQIPEEIKNNRREKIEEMQKQISLEKNERLLGQKVEVLIEEVSSNQAYGRTRWDAPEIDNLVIVEGGDGLRPGDICSVDVQLALEYELIGEIDNEFAQ